MCEELVEFTGISQVCSRSGARLHPEQQRTAKGQKSRTTQATVFLKIYGYWSQETRNLSSYLSVVIGLLHQLMTTVEQCGEENASDKLAKASTSAPHSSSTWVFNGLPWAEKREMSEQTSSNPLYLIGGFISRIVSYLFAR